jgi:hypothetical protein
MSADQGSAATPAVENNTPAPAAATEGPRIVTVLGQEGHKADPAPTAAVPVAPAPQAPAAGSEEKTLTEEGEDGNPQDRDEKTGRFKPGVQKRIDELTRARHEAERQAAYYKGLAEAGGSKPAPQPQQAAEVKPPVRTDFATDDEYIDAMTDFKVEQKLQQREVQQKRVEVATEKATTWQQKVDAAKAEIPDYDAVLEANGNMAVAPHVSEFLMEHDMGAKLVHFLATNPDVLEKLNGMTPAKAAFEIATLAGKFQTAPAVTAAAPGSNASAPAAGQDAPSASSKPAAERAVSKAPPPAASHVGAGRSTESKLEDLSMDDYVARRKAQGAGWANR